MPRPHGLPSEPSACLGMGCVLLANIPVGVHFRPAGSASDCRDPVGTPFAMVQVDTGKALTIGKGPAPTAPEVATLNGCDTCRRRHTSVAYHEVEGLDLVDLRLGVMAIADATDQTVRKR